MKGQMMLLTAIIVSLIMLSTGSAVSKLGEETYHYRSEGHLSNILEDEAEKIDTRFRKDRENYRKMVGFLDRYTTEVDYWETSRCFNVTLHNTETNLNLNCLG